MNESVSIMKKWIKHGAAGLIFSIILLGGSAAALTLLAEGISSISSLRQTALMPSAVSSTVGSVTAPVTPSVPTGSGVPQAGIGSVGSGGQTGPSQQTGSSVQTGPSVQYVVPNLTDKINEQLDHMHSPIGEAIDSGGVVLGDRIQNAFGSFLSNVLQTLFLEQAGSSPTTGAENSDPGVPQSGTTLRKQP